MASIIIILVISLVVSSAISIALSVVLYQYIDLELEPKQEIEILAIVPTKITNTYSYAMKICAGSSQLDNPYVIASSDMETKSYRVLQQTIPTNSCYGSGGIIQALAKESIQLSLTSVYPTSPPNDVKDKINNLRLELNKQNQELSDLLSIESKPSDFNKKFNELTKKISDIRIELKTLRTQN